MAVVEHVLRGRGLPPFEIKVKGGFDNLRSTLRVELRASDLRHLGVIVDADTSIDSRWQSIQNVLRGAGYGGVPELPDPTGTVIRDDGRPAVGIWLMPDNRMGGTLEIFASQLIPAGDQLWPRARACVGSLKAEERLFKPADVPKAEIHTWLAWQQEPGLRMGTAIAAKFLDPAAVEAEVFVRWIQRLLAA